MPRLWYCVMDLPGMLGRHSSCHERHRREEKAKWVRRIQGSTLRHVDFWSLQTAVAAAANVTKPTTQELAEVTLDPPDLRVWALFSSPLPARLSQIARPQAHRKQGLAPPPTCSADHQTSKDHGRAEAQRGASTCPAFRGPPVFGPVLLAGGICVDAVAARARAWARADPRSMCQCKW